MLFYLTCLRVPSQPHTLKKGLTIHTLHFQNCPFAIDFQGIYYPKLESDCLILSEEDGHKNLVSDSKRNYNTHTEEAIPVGSMKVSAAFYKWICHWNLNY